MSDYKDLEQYGIIGNLETCALVGDDGSIDWCCFPHLDSPSVFAGVLDSRKGGRFAITPDSAYISNQQYVTDTNVLRTDFHADTGVATLTDFMPIRSERTPGEHDHQVIYRKLACKKGLLKFKVDFDPHFNYARDTTRIVETNYGLEASSGNHRLHLQASTKFDIKEGGATSTIEMSQGQEIWFVLRYANFAEKSQGECSTELDATVEYWSKWVHDAPADTTIFNGPWRELIVRSGLVLKLLAHERAGAICAAPTTSLPESLGGERNWDYRYNWIRDASFTVQALYNIGHYEEARRHLRWFVEICRKNEDPSKIQIMYGLHGETDVSEIELGHLEGYKKSRPVRVGNGAAKQKQHDIYGELINAIFETGRYGEEIPEEEFEFITRIVNYVCEIWDTPDSGIWEVRGGPRHFVYSKLMCWVALDRGIKIAEHRKYNAPIGKWRDAREEIRKEILEKGYNDKLRSFVQSFGSEVLDATSLMIPIMGFLTFDDPRVQGTIDSTLAKLTTDTGLVYRYIGEDGLSGKEGAFLLCSFWLIKALALSGRTDEAENILNKVLKYAGKTGLFSEEVDPVTGKQLGNLPQAFSHIGLINSVLYLGHVKGISHTGPAPTGAKESSDYKV